MKKIKLVTWNVNGIRASYDKGLNQFVTDISPDILCLQETKAQREQRAGRKQSGLGARYLAGRSGAERCAVSRIGPESVRADEV